MAARVLDRLAQLSRQTAETAGLSEREIEVLGHMVKEAANKEIAAALFIGESTVKTHVANIFQTLEINERTEAVTKAMQRGTIKLYSPKSRTAPSIKRMTIGSSSLLSQDHPSS